MMPPPESPRQPSLREVFLEALSQPTPAERAAYLDGACQGDGRLRAKVEALLRNHREDNFLVEGRGSVFSPPTFSPDGNLIGSMNQQGVLHLWRASSWTEIHAAEETEAKAP